MGVCLSKVGLPHHHPHHHHGFISNDEEGFCTPECVSSQYESPNPSGRHSFAHLDTPRVSADVGDFGVLGSLFYKRGNRSRELRSNMAGGGGGGGGGGGTAALGNYISPLDMFLGGVSGRSRVHHVNQICAGDYSFASYLVSPLLKGFDVHAMEAVAKSYAESAAKAAARDTFVFLEENDVSVTSFQGGRGGLAATGTTRKEGATATAAAIDEDGDVDDELAKSGESEDWEEPKKAENRDHPHDEKSDSRSGQFKAVPHFRASGERGTSDRWVSVLNAVQARAKARRRQKRKGGSGQGQGQGSKERGAAAVGAVAGSKKKTVRFQVDGVQEGVTDDDIRSGKESEYDPAEKDATLAATAREGGAEVHSPAEGVHMDGKSTGDEYDDDDDDGGIQEKKTVECSNVVVVGNSGLISGSGTSSIGIPARESALSEEEIDYYLWQEEDEGEGAERGARGDNGGEGGGDGFYREGIVDAEFAGFTAAEVVGGLRATASEVFDGLRAASGPTPPPPMAAFDPGRKDGGEEGHAAEHHVHVHHPSLESFSSGEYFLPEGSFGDTASSREHSSSAEVKNPPGGRAEEGDDEEADEDDEATSAETPDREDPSAAALHLEGEDGEDDDDEEDEDEEEEEEEDQDGEDYEENGDSDSDAENRLEDDDDRQCSLTDYATCDESEPTTGNAVPISSRSAPVADPPSSFTKDIPVSEEGTSTTSGKSSLPAIPVGCVVVESRLADGSRLNPQILDPSQVPLPERGEKNHGFFHARVLCSGESSPSDPNSDHEGAGGGFSFPVLLPSSSAARPPPASSLPNLDASVKNRTVMVHSVHGPNAPPRSGPTTAVREIHEIQQPNSAQRPAAAGAAFPFSSSEDKTHHHPSSSFTFDVEPALDAKKVHEIILPSPPPVPARSVASSPVFTPSASSSKSPVSALRSTTSPAPLLPAVPVPSIPYPQRARRTFNRKLKFYSLERASYAAAAAATAVAKPTPSPPSFAAGKVRDRRRDAPDGESDSDLFEIETMSGTNAMGSSRTPPSTPTMGSVGGGGSCKAAAPPAAASFDFDKLSDSIARVSRCRSKRGGGGSGLPPVPEWPPSRHPRSGGGRCIPVERRRDRVFEERDGRFAPKGGFSLQTSLKGRALLKLGLLMRSKLRPPTPPELQDAVREDGDAEPHESGGVEAGGASEYSENNPPLRIPTAAPANGPNSSAANRHFPHAQRVASSADGERAPPSTQNYSSSSSFDWYNCSSLDPRKGPFSHEKRLQQRPHQQQHNPFATHNRPFTTEDRTVSAVVRH